MLRDTYAIRYLQAGGELEALQDQLGVACLSSVRRYQHFCEQRQEERQAQAWNNAGNREDFVTFGKALVRLARIISGGE